MVEFDKYFLVEPLRNFHKMILMRDFIGKIAPNVWPLDKRKGRSLIALFFFSLSIILNMQSFELFCYRLRFSPSYVLKMIRIFFTI